ncbi:hypothetical protein NDU88_004028 [Pleurodeles waltl]|uniref:Uncharacterized protein n=1 Tax=Pleurodeles waltl TaxID=8319 RepID=A0AAV7TQN7_PLEWA|nr:hypothetical protein NDU88_004028 [Pleurodeles waltl]
MPSNNTAQHHYKGASRLHPGQRVPMTGPSTRAVADPGTAYLGTVALKFACRVALLGDRAPVVVGSPQAVAARLARAVRSARGERQAPSVRAGCSLPLTPCSPQLGHGE